MYEQGHGSTSYVANLASEGREQLTWTPVRDIVDALDKAFYLFFKFVFYYSSTSFFVGFNFLRYFDRLNFPN